MNQKPQPLSFGKAVELAGPFTVCTDIDEALLGLFNEYIWLTIPQEQQGRLTQVYLVDEVFSSDEIACVKLYRFDGVDLALVTKYGDKTDWVVRLLDSQSHDAFHEFARNLLEKPRIEPIGADDPIVEDRNGYVFHSDGDLGPAIHVTNPRWGAFEYKFKRHTAYASIDSQIVYPVSFVRWATAERYGETAHDVVLGLPEGSQATLHGGLVGFLLEEKQT